MTDGQKRSVCIAGHRTSVSLEPDFWTALKEIAKEQGTSLNELITQIDRERTQNAPQTGLSSALRVYILRYFRAPHR